MENIKNLNELLVNAQTISDARTKVFNTLTTSIKETLIPALVNIMKGYGLSRIYICTKAKPIYGFEGYTDPQSEEIEYGICIMEDGTICEVEYDYMKDEWGDESYELEDYQLLKSGAIDLGIAILKKIEVLNEKYSGKNEKAQSLVNIIANEFGN